MKRKIHHNRGFSTCCKSRLNHFSSFCRISQKKKIEKSEINRGFCTFGKFSWADRSIFFLIFNVVLCCRRAAHAQIGRDDRRSQKTENPNLFRVEICKERSPSECYDDNRLHSCQSTRRRARTETHNNKGYSHRHLLHICSHTRFVLL